LTEQQPRKVAGVAAGRGRGVFRRKTVRAVVSCQFPVFREKPKAVVSCQLPVARQIRSSSLTTDNWQLATSPRLTTDNWQLKTPRRAFTFIEVLFSVIIIGVGFIMLAAMFPVAIQQSQTNLAASVAVSVGRDALRDIQSAVSGYVTPNTTAGAINLILPPTVNQTGIAGLAVTTYPVMPLPNILSGYTAGGVVVAQSSAVSTITPGTYATVVNGSQLGFDLANPAILAATANQVYAADRRFGWVGFYRRDWITQTINSVSTAVPSPYAQVWVITAQSQAEGQPSFPAAFSYPTSGTSPQTTGTSDSAAGTSGVNITTYNGFPNPLVTPNNICNAILTYNNQSSGSATYPQGSSITIPSTSGGSGQTGPMAGTGAYVLVLNDQPLGGGTLTANTGVLINPRLIGQVYRIGSVSPSTTSGSTSTTWSLISGADLSPTDFGVTTTTPNVTTSENVTIFVLGSPLSVQGGVANYNGNIQDVSCTSSVIRVNN
jgi:type II secretory pathway pseudopilin PulG